MERKEKDPCRYLIFYQDFDKTLRSLSGRVQKEMRRKLRKISRLGRIELIRIQRQAEIADHLKLFFKFHGKTWKGEEPSPEFFKKICLKYNEAQELLFYSLTLNGTPLAYLISLLGEDRVFGIRTTYDPSYAQYSPGTICFYKALEEISRIPGVTRFEFGKGEDRYKKEWTSMAYPHKRLLVYPDAFLNRICKNVHYDTVPWLTVRSKRLLSYAKNRLTWTIPIRRG